MAEPHSVGTTLDDIITELRLSYDSTVGLLDGESIQTIPNLNTLLNLNKLLNKLYNALSDVESADDEVITSLKSKVEEVEEETDKKRVRESSEETQDEGVVKSEASVEIEEKEEEDAEEDSINLAKRRKLSSVADEEDDIKQEDNEEEPTEQVNSKDDPVPPVQSGSYTQESDTRLKNPKSEFVESQTLSTEAIAKLGLFQESQQDTPDREYLKRKFGVASFPENDLQSLLPGTIPNTDFSKNKPPTNQVQFSTFQTYIEPYFRLFSTEDIEFLRDRNIIPPGLHKQDYDGDITPFLIPKLGRFYADVWSEEDATLSSKLNSPAFQQPQLDSYKPKGSIDIISDDILYTEEVSCGPLSSRLLAAILSTHEGTTPEEEEPTEQTVLEEDEEHIATQLDSIEDYKVTTEVNDFQSIEERLKRELKYIGIFMNLPLNDDKKSKQNGRIPKKLTASIIDNDEWIKNKEDDEVCAEIRTLQKELKETISRNRANKKKLIPVVEEHIAFQEYCAILEDLDKQIDQAYIKRMKGKSKKKKVEANTPQQQALNNGLRALLEKRRRWIENIGKLFPNPEIMKRVPTESILVKLGEVDLEPGEDENTDNVSTAVEMIQKV
ncbi:Chromatin-remodeling complexes subunit NGG1 [Spathaspora sp. JA1]|nr:Chromatin-remodeling complexes subunit NGG1 [Spathaspora sp. JA1]